MAKKRISHVKKKGLDQKPQTRKPGRQQNTRSEAGPLIHLQRQVGNRALQRQVAQQPDPAGGTGTPAKRRYTRTVQRSKGNEAAAIIYRDQDGPIAGILEIDTNENLDRFLNNQVTADQLVRQGHAMWSALSVRKEELIAAPQSGVSQPGAAVLSPLAESFREELQIVIDALDAKGVSNVWQEAQESDLSKEELETLRKMIAPALIELCDQNLTSEIKSGNIKGMLQSIEPAMRAGLDDAVIEQLTGRMTAAVEKITRQKVGEAIKRGDIKDMLQSLEPAMYVGVDAKVTGELMERITAKVEKITRRKVDQAVEAGDTKGALRSLETAQMLGVDTEVVEELMNKISQGVSQSRPKR